MIKGIYYAANNMLAKNKDLEIVANNLANISTVGFKREVPFSEVMSREIGSPLKQITDFTVGNLIQTSNPLDLVISEDAFFVLKTSNGVEYTKKGRYTLSDDGYIQNEEGLRLLGEKGEINVYEGALEKDKPIIITKNGEVKVGEIVVDRLLAAKFFYDQRALRIDGVKFIPDDGFVHLASEGEFEVIQGYLEESNINPILEMQAMISISKEFEAAQKSINALDQSLEKANDVGKI